MGDVAAPAVTRPVLGSTPSDDSGDVPDLVSTDQGMPPTSGTEAHIVHREERNRLLVSTFRAPVKRDPGGPKSCCYPLA